MFGARRPATSKDQPRLPRGECRFILLHPEINGQRCCCQSFWHNEAVPGASCECGHQACYHESNNPSEGVSREEHQALAKRVAQLDSELAGDWAEHLSGLQSRIKGLEDTIDSISQDREDGTKEVYRAVQGVYQHVQHAWTNHSRWLMHHDDKAEAIVDKVSGFTDDVRNLRERVIHMDDINMSLEDRLGELEKRSGPLNTASELQQSEPANHQVISEQPSQSSPSKIRVHLWPSQLSTFDVESAAYKRCRSRGLVRTLYLKSTCARAIRNNIEAFFSGIIRGRRWVPMVAKLPSAEARTHRTLHPLSDDQSCSDLWDAAFFTKKCAILDETGKMTELYISLREEMLSWEEIRQQAVFEEGLERCWDHDETLDGKAPMDDEGLDVNEPLEHLTKAEMIPVDGNTALAPASTKIFKRSFASLSDDSAARKNAEEVNKRIKLRTSLPELQQSAVHHTSPRTSEVA